MIVIDAALTTGWPKPLAAEQRRVRDRSCCALAVGARSRRIKIDFVPPHAADFLTAAAQQNKQPYNAPVVVIAAGAPDLNQLGVRENMIARLWVGGPMRSIHRVCAVAEKAVRNGPREEC